MRSVRVLGGRYRLIERLGGGGMSIVWRAYDEVLGRQVAVKVLANQETRGAALRESIRAEAQAAARLSHPHITLVHDYGESRTESGEFVPYVVMELVHGPTLAERLKEGPLPVQTALLICAQVAAALAAAHARGLVHRDIKPSNVMLSPSGAKVVDFGIAAVAGARTESPAKGELWGTPAYLAPERLTRGEVVPASDVYALGLLLYRVLAGRLPWRAQTTTEMLKAHRYVEPVPLPQLPGVPAQVVALCRDCMAKQPDQRPSAADAARVLAEASGWKAITEPGGNGVVGTGMDSDADTQVVPIAGAGDSEPAAAGAALAGPLAVRAALGGAALAGPLAVRAALGGPTASEAAAAGPAAGEDRPVTATPDKRRRWVATIVAALAVLAVGLLAGFCGAGYGPRSPGRDPGAGGPTVSGSASVHSGQSGGPGSNASGAAPGSAPGGPAGSGAGGQAAGGQGAGGQAAGGQPTGGGQTAGPGAPPQNAGPTPVERTVVTPGGTVTCRCVGQTASLVSWVPAPGFTATQVNAGPGTEVGLVFSAIGTNVRVTFRCRDGVPEWSIS